MSRNGMSIFLVVAVMISACTRSSGIIYTPPALEGEWIVRMTQSGGIMGMMRSIEVAADGRYVAADQRAGDIVKGEFTEDELKDLMDMVAALEFTSSLSTAECADCFMFNVEIQGSGQKMIVQADDLSLEDSGLEALVRFLSEKMDSALQ